MTTQTIEKDDTRKMLMIVIDIIGAAIGFGLVFQTKLTLMFLASLAFPFILRLIWRGAKGAVRGIGNLGHLIFAAWSDEHWANRK